MSIRAASPNDAAAVAAIWNRVIAETTITFTSDIKSEPEVARLIVQDTLVWEQSGQVTGFARVGAFRSGPGYRHTGEHTIMLAPAAQGQGAGRTLMEALCAHARAAGLRHLIAGCSGEHPTAVAFHRAVGFTKVATLPKVGFKFGRSIDLILLQKTL